ncbi:hypothetical protein Tco_0935181 [Tanacetum coccineum]
MKGIGYFFMAFEALIKRWFVGLCIKDGSSEFVLLRNASDVDRNCPTQCVNTMAEQNVPAQAPTRTDDQITGVYCCQVDKQWFNLSADLLRKALDITPVDPAHPFELPPTGDTTAEWDNQDTPVLTNVLGQYVNSKLMLIHAELLWEEFTQGIHTFFSHKASHKASLKDPKKKAVPLLIPYGKKGKPSFQLVDEDDEAQQEPVPQGEGDDLALELAKKMSLDANQEKGEGEGADADIERAIKLSLDHSFLPQGQAPVRGVTIRDPVSETTPKLPEVVGKAPHDSITGPSSQPEDDTSEKLVLESSSTTDSERTESGTEAAAPQGDKEQGAVASSTVTSGVGISDLFVKKQKNQAGSENLGKAQPNPEHMDEEFLAYHKQKSLPKDDQEKSKVVDESDSTIPDPSHQTVTSTPPVIAPVIDFSSPKPSSQVTTPPITTEATSITTTLPEITPFIALQLRVAKLEQDMSEVKKTDHSAAALASIKSQVPTVVDKYLGTKLDDALLRILERHTTYLIKKYSMLPGPKSIKN